MKPLLTILILLPCFCFGQKKDLEKRGTSSIPGYGIGSTLDFYIETSYQKTDTIPVIMLVCDTTKETDENLVSLITLGSGETMSKKTGRRGYFLNGYLNDTWWMFGYEVFEPVVRWSMGEIPEKKYPIYLDSNRKPLPKSIVVWITKTIKK